MFHHKLGHLKLIVINFGLPYQKMNLYTACKNLTKDHLILSKECDDIKKDITGDQGYVTTNDKKSCVAGGENDKNDELLMAVDHEGYQSDKETRGDSEGNDIGDKDPQDSDENASTAEENDEEFNIMLEPNEMKKMYMILANKKHSVPLKSTCIILNHNFVHTGGKTYERSHDDENFYLNIDEKLDVIIYITDVIFHEVNDMQKEFDAKFELLNEKMAAIDKKLDILLNHVNN